MESPSTHDRICALLSSKSVMKQNVYATTTAGFALLKRMAEELAEELRAGFTAHDERVHIRYTDKGPLAAEMQVAGDTLLFHMHTNVFRLEQANPLWRSSYLSTDEERGYFGLINIYNFLSDSFTYNRERDLGYLVARIFLNKDGHFFVQGKKQLGFLYADPARNSFEADTLKELLRNVALHVMDFDLLAPPYDQVSQVTLMEMNELNANMKLSTGKRLGFQFAADVEDEFH